MADVKQILVVDDHFEMLEFLRTVLEHSGRDYQVLAVPSAEEGMLELLRTPFDLLITDVRLPGMSGFDLIRRVRRVRKELPVIMISGYGQEQGQQEANALNVVHYFVKPIDSDVLIRTVRHVLHGEPLTPTPPAPPEPVAVPVPILTDLSSELVASLNQRLQTLRNEISATYLTLTDTNGRILTDSGIGVGLVSPGLLGATTDGLRQSQKVADYLGNRETFTLQYHAGDKAELYALNVGEQHLLLIFFAAESRRGRVGTVWVFAQRFAKELLQLLPQGETTRPPAAPTPTPVIAPPSAPVTVPEQPTRSSRRGRDVPDLPDFPSKTLTREEKRAREEKAIPAQPSPPVALPPTPTPTPKPVITPPPVAAASTPAFSFAEAMRQGLISGELTHGHDEPHSEDNFDNLFDLAGESLPGDEQLLSLDEAQPPSTEASSEAGGLDLPTDVPADDSLADWLNNAAANEPTPGQGLSFAEAMRLGLLPGELTSAIPPTAEPEIVIKTVPVPASESTTTNMPLEEAQRLGLLPYDLLGDTDHEPSANLDDLFALTPDEAIDLDSFWDEAIAVSEDKTQPGISLTEVQALGMAFDDIPSLAPTATTPPQPLLEPLATEMEALFNTPMADDVDLDAFWADAVTKEQDTAAATNGLSLDEARRKGLVGPDLSWTKQN